MAKQSGLIEITREANTDLSSYQFHIVTLTSAGKIKLAIDADVVAEPMLGVLQNKPNASGQEAVIAIAGQAKVMGGDTSAAGTAITCDSSGHAVAAVANDWVLGVLLETNVSGRVVEILIRGGGGHVVPA